MSALSYYKMLYVQHNMKKKIHKVQQTCAAKPKSRECKIAWDELDSFAISYDTHVEHLKKQGIFIEFPWEEPSKFYDI
jgi:hypothetical protein